ncbi:MAG: GNAT family N-acetyltransferase [bacterium]|nr:GNAT family N-acetyltransferase [bacterium]
MKIRAYEKGDEQEIMALDARALPSEWNPRTLNNWYWKFTDKNPAGHSLIWVADHKEQMVAHFAAVPYKLKVKDQVVTASHSIGALVEVKYQNRGLLKLVGDKLMEDLKAKAFPFTWGFPNKRAYEFEKMAMGYGDLTNFDVWTLQKKNLAKTGAHASFKAITAFNHDFDKLWETCADDYPIAVVRDKTYLQWRYMERPDWDYFPYALYEGDTLIGYVVLKLYREGDVLRGHIVDIFARKADQDTLARLIDGSMNFFIDKDVDEVTIFIMGNPLIEQLFTARSFTQVEANIPLILKINTDHKYNALAKDPSQWYFTMGDSTEVF